MNSFKDYVKNREKFIGKDDDILASADVGSIILKKGVKKHVYEIEGYRCKTLEEVERVAKSMGINLRNLDYAPEVIPAGAGKIDFIVKFISKEAKEKRDKW